MPQGVIFDIDGTLVDSDDVPFDVVRPLIGMEGDKLLPKDGPADLLARYESSLIGRESQ